MKSIASASASAAWASTTSGLPFFCSSPTESRATRGRSTPEHRLAEGRAEVGELDQVLGADLGVGADVEEEHRRAAVARQREPGPRARDGGRPEPLQREQRRGHRRAGGAGADQGAGAALGDVGRRPHDRGVRAWSARPATGSASLAIQPPSATRPRPRRGPAARPGRRPGRRCRRPRRCLAPSSATSGPSSVPCASSATGAAQPLAPSAVAAAWAGCGAAVSGTSWLMTSRPA